MVQVIPESYHAQPARYAANQLGHVALGMLATLTFCAAIDAAFGEIPYKATIVVVMFAGYLRFELRRQGWHRWDTVQDTFFFYCGVLVLVIPFTEAGRFSGIVSGDIATAALCAWAISACLIAGTAVKFWERDADLIRAIWAGPGWFGARALRVWNALEF